MVMQVLMLLLIHLLLLFCCFSTTPCCNDLFKQNSEFSLIFKVTFLLLLMMMMLVMAMMLLLLLLLLLPLPLPILLLSTTILKYSIIAAIADASTIVVPTDAIIFFAPVIFSFSFQINASSCNYLLHNLFRLFLTVVPFFYQHHSPW